MNPIHLVLSAILLLAGTAATAPAQQKTQPGPGTELPPLEKVPDKPSNAERERYEKKMRAEVEAWERRVELFVRGAKQSGTKEGTGDADMVNRALRALKNQWQNLIQAQGPNWELVREKFEQARSDMNRTWTEVTKK